ncbi:MAG: hypothetical protein ACYC5O_10155 [Anaerolineae bacterium]
MRRRARTIVICLCLVAGYLGLLWAGGTPAIVWFLSPGPTQAGALTPTLSATSFADLATAAASSLAPVTARLTAVPPMPLPLILRTEWTELTVEGVALWDRVYWQGEEVAHEGDAWFVVYFTIANLRAVRPDTLVGGDLGLVVDGTYEISLNRDATGGAGLAEGVPATPAGAAGIDVRPKQVVRTLAAFDLPPDHRTLQLRYRTQLGTLPFSR